jgi:hypothetical protein
MSDETEATPKAVRGKKAAKKRVKKTARAKKAPNDASSAKGKPWTFPKNTLEARNLVTSNVDAIALEAYKTCLNSDSALSVSFLKSPSEQLVTVRVAFFPKTAAPKPNPMVMQVIGGTISSGSRRQIRFDRGSGFRCWRNGLHFQAAAKPRVCCCHSITEIEGDADSDGASCPASVQGGRSDEGNRGSWRGNS